MELIRGAAQSRALQSVMHVQKRFLKRPAVNTSQVRSSFLTPPVVCLFLKLPYSLVDSWSQVEELALWP